MRFLRRLFRRRRLPDPIDEAQAYARSYGERTGDIVKVEHVEPKPARSRPETLTGELLRRAFELRLEARSKRSSAR